MGPCEMPRHQAQLSPTDIGRSEGLGQQELAEKSKCGGLDERPRLWDETGHDA